jgi:hypothetical protein
MNNWKAVHRVAAEKDIRRIAGSMTGSRIGSGMTKKNKKSVIPGLIRNPDGAVAKGGTNNWKAVNRVAADKDHPPVCRLHDWIPDRVRDDEKNKKFVIQGLTRASFRGLVKDGDQRNGLGFPASGL